MEVISVVESLRFIVVTMKFTVTPSMKASDQEILSDPNPFGMAARLVGRGGGPGVVEAIRKYQHPMCLFNIFN